MGTSKIVERVKAALGDPVITVHTPDSSIELFKDDGLELLTAKCLRTVEFMVPSRNQIKLNPQEIRIVVDVKPYTGQANIIGARTYPEGDDGFYTRSEFTLNELLTFYNFKTQGIMTPILANMLYNQMTNALGAKFDWHYDNQTGELTTTNRPGETQLLWVMAKTLYTEETLEQEKRNWLYAYTLARTKQTEGRIRSKFKEGSNAAPSDGDTLVQEATTELEACKQELDTFVNLNYGVRR